ncbi:MAG: biotin--[acetyl-CoA-carboxylase] ligase [Acidiferrobacterales bacterium]
MPRRSRPLSRQKILAELGNEARVVEDRLHLMEEVDSTNLWMHRRIKGGDLRSGTVCVAEAQSAGQGRAGRSWVATAYRDVMLSMAWRFSPEASLGGGLSLAAAVAVVRGLRDCGISGAGLKWPNDVMWRERKLAGLLVEMTKKSSAGQWVVAGVGVNVCVGDVEAARIDQPWADLESIAGGVDRSALIGRLVGQLRTAFRTYTHRGFAAFRDEWQQLHTLTGQQVRLLRAETPFIGCVRGIDNDGALLVADESGRVQRFHSGDISVRPTSETLR